MVFIKKYADICRRRRVTELIHFTPLDNLDSIVRLGLLSRDSLFARNILFSLTDMERFDGCIDAVSLSVSFPNYSMFYKKRKKLGGEWGVLSISPGILESLDCSFCEHNASSNCVEGRKGVLARKEPESFERMFAEHCDGPLSGFLIERRSLGIPPRFPTDPQAEVLVFDRVDPKFIQGIYVKSGCRISSDIPVLEKDEYFRPRADYRYWKNVGR